MKSRVLTLKIGSAPCVYVNAKGDISEIIFVIFTGITDEAGNVIATPEDQVHKRMQSMRDGLALDHLAL